MPHIANLDQKSAEQLLSHMNDETGRTTDSGPFQIAVTAIRLRSISALTKSIDEFRKSSERASRAIIGLTVVLAATAVIQVLLVILK